MFRIENQKVIVNCNCKRPSVVAKELDYNCRIVTTAKSASERKPDNPKAD